MILAPDERHALIAELTERQASALLWDWRMWARPNQIPPPGDWRVWLILAGRGFGKTRTGAEWVRERIKRYSLINIIGATVDDARDIMIDGESGILACCPDNERPTYRANLRRLDWPNGARTLVFTADEPERLRGKQHMGLWLDELAAWRRPEAYDQAMLGLRLGDDPQAVATTTPKPTPLIRRLVADPTTHITRGSTYDNAANLAPQFMQQIIARYEGTRLGRQELLAEILTDTPGALWRLSMFDERRPAPALARVVIGVDPAASSNEDSDETGIIVAGHDGVKGSERGYYVLGDYSCRESPDGWARRVLHAFDLYRADRVIVEVNNGGEMATAVLKTLRPNLPITAVHASRGKAVRAEPIAALYEQGRAWHTEPFPTLEDQMTTWAPGDPKSPDRMDAAVWALTDLSEQKREVTFFKG